MALAGLWLGDVAVPLWISPLLKKPDIQRVIALPYGGLQGQPVVQVSDDGTSPIEAGS
ncbi:MAG: hypothetical protein ACYCUY_00245 [Acidithiobacillus sp.]